MNTTTHFYPLPCFGMVLSSTLTSLYTVMFYMHVSYILKDKEWATLCISILRTYLEDSKDPGFTNNKQVDR
jgi:hypothetical protein